MRRSGALWGALLIFIGLAWILGSADWISIDILGSLFDLWPIFIIAAGVTFFFRKDAHLPRVILWILVFAVIGGYGIYLGYNDIGGAEGNKTFEMKPGIKTGYLQVNLGGADFGLGSASLELADISTNARGIEWRYDEGSTAKIVYSQKLRRGISGRQSFDAKLNSTIPWSIEINTGASGGTLDFSDIALKNCTINTGGCDIEIIAGSKLPESRININGGAVSINIAVPDNVGLKISASSAVTNINGSVNMLKSGHVHTSENFDEAPSKIYLDISSGVSNITIN